MLEKKHQKLLNLFAHCKDSSAVYNKIIEIGQRQKLKKFDYQSVEYQVSGCQSELYLYPEVQDGKMFFKAYSEALISLGLAHLLIEFYNGETPETILKTPPTFLEALNIPSSLTPSRANGLYHIHLKMKQQALAAIVTAN